MMGDPAGMTDEGPETQCRRVPRVCMAYFGFGTSAEGKKNWKEWLASSRDAGGTRPKKKLAAPWKAQQDTGDPAAFVYAGSS